MQRRADFHIHTNLSWCAAKEMSLDAIVRAAQTLGMSTVGLADHLWLDPRRGCRPAVSRLLSLREPLARLRAPIRLLLGAEADCAPHRGLAGGDEVRQLDFVIASYHFTDVREGATPWPEAPEELAARLVDGFRSLIQAPGVSIAGHPFFIPPRVYHRLPVNLQEHVGDAFNLVQREVGALFEEAARRRIAIEFNAKALGPLHRQPLLPLFRLARECGCGFVLSSDAHRLEELGRTHSLADYLKMAGVTGEKVVSLDDIAGVGA